MSLQGHTALWRLRWVGFEPNWRTTDEDGVAGTKNTWHPESVIREIYLYRTGVERPSPADSSERHSSPVAAMCRGSPPERTLPTRPQH